MMPKPMRRTFTCFAAALFLASCGGGSDGPIGDQGYVPNTDGFKWTYALTQEGAPASTAVAQLDGTEQVAGSMAQRMRLTSELASGTLLGEISATRLRVFSTEFFGRTLLFETPLQLMRFPFELGDEFNASTRFSVGLLPVDLQVDTTVAGFGPIVAGGRSYEDAFRLESTAELTAIGISFQAGVTTWLAPAIGAVRGEVDIPQNPLFPVSGRITAELASAGP